MNNLPYLKVYSKDDKLVLKTNSPSKAYICAELLHLDIPINLSLDYTYKLHDAYLEANFEMDLNILINSFLPREDKDILNTYEIIELYKGEF